MTSAPPRWSAIITAFTLLVGGFVSACSTTWVVVAPPPGGYSALDTLRGVRNGEDEVRVVFRFDTIIGVDTVIRLDTLYAIRTDTVVVVAGPAGADRPGGPAPVGIVRPGGAPPNPGFQPAPATRVDTVRVVVNQVRVDTVRVPGAMQVRIDTVRIAGPVRVDTVRVTGVGPVRVDTVRIATVDTVVQTQTVLRPDTVRITGPTVVRVDTVRVAVTDTVIRTEVVRSPGRRVLFVPPGQHPPEGQCRVWIFDLPPGQQASPTPCDQLNGVPAGAFVLFRGDAWDFDYDWIAEASATPGSVPLEIVAVKRRGG